MSSTVIMIHLATCVVIISAVVCKFTNASTDVGEDEIVIKTSSGPVKGVKVVSSWTNKTIYSFRGIPYASPPLGDLRFKDPVPPKAWIDVKDCTKEVVSCPQQKSPFSNIPFNTSEDCLYVNVYSPQIEIGGSLLPVMVWIHGGAFIEGSGSYFRYGPDFLVGEGVIVVTLNYRLGALGFLALGTSSVPGNAGLKDQWFALKWVQKEIRQFGGDPSNVTIFGESAGSSSVHFQYLSPLSKGLFHRVIGESGAALSNWAVRNDGQFHGLKLAEKLNCSTANIQAAEKCLRAADVNDILNAQAHDGTELVFVPTLDKNTSTTPFLPDFPKALYEKGEGSFVPFIMGINSDEGMMMLSLFDDKIKNITNTVETMIPSEVKQKSSESRIKLLIERIKNFYFKEPPSPSNLKGYIDLYTDYMFGYSTAVSAKSFRNRANVYLYYFSFNGKFKEKIVEYIQQKYNFSGVSHAEEMNYIFIREKVNQTAGEDSDEMKTWRRMVRMWTNFAKFGTPTVDGDSELENVTWSPVGNVTTKYLQIDVNLTMVNSDFLAPRVALWDSITPSSSPYLEATGLAMATAAVLYLAK